MYSLPAVDEGARDMAKFWWVNHKQTHRQEIEGAYLWSPKVEKNGARSHFYDNMRVAAPGDYVVSMAHGQVSYIGCVVDYAISSPKPEEFGKIGDYWRHEGWLLPMVWATVAQPIKPKDIAAQLTPLLRERYAPLQRDTGNGNQKAYLSEIDEALFSLIEERTRFTDIESLSSQRTEHSSSEFSDALESVILSKIDNDHSLSTTERNEIRKARIGQGVFRRNVFAISSQCRATGISAPELLIASHIKPWRSCENAKERLDGHNGLALAPHIDFLFDRGLIGFEDAGNLLISTKLEKMNIQNLGLAVALERPSVPFSERYRPYLAHHRNNVFLR